MEKLSERRYLCEPPIATFLHAKTGIPISGTFELTARCNFNCAMCYIHSKDSCKKNELSAKQWLEIANQCRDRGTVFLLLTGGEPLIRNDFSDIYSELSKMGFIISLNTNASLLDDSIFSLFEKSPPSRVNVSLYGAGDDTYYSLCGVRCFEKVTENIRRLSSMGIDTVINFSVTKENLHDMSAVVEIAKELGLHMKAATYMYPRVRVSNELAGENSGRLSPEDAAKARMEFCRLYYPEDELIRRAEGIVQQAESFFDRRDIHKSRCRAGKTAFWIDSEGRMSMCGMTGTDKNSVLSEGFDSCWASVREGTESLRLFSGCTECKLSGFCNVCAAVCMSETGRFDLRPDYVCRMNRALLEEAKQLINNHTIKGSGQ